MFTIAASSTVAAAGRISSSSSTSSSSKSTSSSSFGLISKSAKTNNFVSFQSSSQSSSSSPAWRVVARATENEEDEYMFKPTANAGGKGGVLDRDNPLLEEKFAVIGDGEHECQSCMYQYSPKKGDDFYPVSAGTQFKDLPEDWNCPVCGASKSKFKSIGRQVAGFEQNQGYGFGTNSMTEGEKSRLIYGSLALFFAFFLAGYLLE
jgi:rubredoxin